MISTPKSFVWSGREHDDEGEAAMRVGEPLAEHALWQAAALGGPAYDCLPVGVVVVDGQRRVCCVNAELSRMLALAPGVLTIPCPLEGGNCPAPLAQLLNPSQAPTLGPYAVAIDMPAGDQKTLEVTPSLLDEASGSLVSVVRDVTAERAEAQNTGLLLALIAHELRAPIQHVMGFAGIITDVDDLPVETLRRFVNHISDESVRMARLVDDLAEFSRIEQGRVQVEQKPILLDAVLGGLVSRMTPGAEARGITLSLEMPAAPAPINSDALRLEQVFCNLIENALKFVPSGGRVDVSLRAEPDAWLIRVSDSGPGVPPEALPRLFEKYYQASHVQGMARNGMGLGLYISQQIVRALGGDIRADSSVGIGTTFTVRLPSSRG